MKPELIIISTLAVSSVSALYAFLRSAVKESKVLSRQVETLSKVLVDLVSTAAISGAVFATRSVGTFVIGLIGTHDKVIVTLLRTTETITVSVLCATLAIRIVIDVFFAKSREADETNPAGEKAPPPR